MNTAPNKIHLISPVKSGMNKEEAKAAIKSFLKDTLGNQRIIQQNNIESVDQKRCVAREYTLITLNDGSSWVQGRGGLQRVVGADYLQKQLKDRSLDKWSAVETKCFFENEESDEIKIKIGTYDRLKGLLVIDSDSFISCSKYVGDNKPDISWVDGDEFLRQCAKEKNLIVEEIGFTDFPGNANIREISKENQRHCVIIDTEYVSFSSQDMTEGAVSAETMAELNGVEFTYSLADILS